MGLNRVSNPKKLRRLSAVVGAPVIGAFARFFAEETTLLVFTEPTTAFVVRRDGSFEPYDERVELVARGVRTFGTRP